MTRPLGYGPAAAPVAPTAMFPADQNLLAWSFDPALAVSSTGPVSGVLALTRVVLREAVTVTNVLVGVATAGVGLTAAQNVLGLYTAAGVLVGQTADQTTAWGTTGVKTAAVTAPYAAAPGVYWVGILSVATTSTPAFARAGAGAVTGISSAGLAATASRFASYGTTLTALPTPLTLGSIATATNGTFWAALS